ncbi:ESX secretion-associated protein EspG [Streptoalloteichus hindustanus]|uniref:EspG family protein n=1 Tax=Streptoalloteichus hindustanus TaxID=2017 RepID=A0A1M5QBR3_STRHI|nr:ESX secretion-associated protein EspG [Streptoalloteichus hindustanus]SHH11199.1 EspG family protein [Streptoalloteichus hindustanus]
MTGVGGAASMVLTAAEMDVCWEYLRLGESPPQLDLPSPGRTWEERQRVSTHALTALRERGLADHRGPVTDLDHALDLLAHWHWSVDAHLWLDQLVRAVAAVRGEVGALAVRVGNDVRLTILRDYRVVDELVALAGPVPAGPGDALSVRAEVFDAAVDACADDPRALAEKLAERGESVTTARALVRMLEGVGWFGQFGASVDDAYGPSRRAPRVVGFHDTARGRYAQVRRLHRDGARLTVAPAGHRRLVTQIRELLDEIESGD